MTGPAPKSDRPAGGTVAGRGPAPAGAAPNASGVLLQLERDARHAETADALAYIAVNQTRRLIAYRQALLVRRDARGRFKVVAVSNVATVERNAPYIVWVRGALKALDRADGLGESRFVTPDALPEGLAGEWRDWWPNQVRWQPFVGRDGRVGGGLIVLREAPAFTEAEGVLLDQLSDAYGHALAALGGLGRGDPGARRRIVRRAVLLAAVAGLVALMALPVRQSAIAPARIAPEDPQVVSAPLDGVIKEVLVDPNQRVEKGALLAVFEPEELEARREVAARALAVAEAELRRAQQQAFGDPDSKAEIALKRTQVELKRAEAAYSQSRLERIEIRAPSAGVAVFSDPNTFSGRPVRVGERVMQIADPARARIQIDLPVADAIALEEGAEVRVFLDVDPLSPVPGRLERASFEASETSDGVLAYSVSAALPGEGPPPRIGLRGSAKIYGETVPLALYLFRRPIAAARQFFGF